MKQILFYALLFSMVFFTLGTSFSGEIPEEDQHILLKALDAEGYSDAVVQFNLRIKIPKIADNTPVDLWGTLIKHAGDEPLPTILVATCYRREFLVTLAATLFPRGYNILSIDLRGTGSAEDLWYSLESEEHLDTAFVVDEWIPKHPWSDGKVGMIGPSYMAIIQLMAAGNIKVDDEGNPVHLKALFPLVPTSDVYKDIVMHGGNLDLAFIPLWLLGTDLLAMLPSTLWLGGENAGMDGSWEDPDTDIIKEAGKNWMNSVKSVQFNVSWFTNPENITDGEFFDEKSPMIYWPNKNPNGHNSIGQDKTIPVNLPVFMTGGWFDIFTNGTLKYYQYGLSEHDDKDKALIMGPWYHIGGSMGLGVEGLMPTTNAIPARWFDWKIKGIEDPFMVDYPVILYVMGEKKWRAEKSWPLPESRLEKKSYSLSKKKALYNWKDWFSYYNFKNNYRLVEKTTSSDFKRDDPVLVHKPMSLHGLISRSTSRWLIGVPSLITQVSRYLFGYNIDHTSLVEDERLDEVGVLTFTTEKLKEDLEIVGPMTLTFWARTKFDEPVPDSWLYQFLDMFFEVTGNKLDEDDNNLKTITEEKDVQWVVEVNDVFPAGRARNITSGWLRASHRPYDDENEHEVDTGYTPFDPFYDKADRTPKLIKEGELYKYVVEVWPTCNVFKKGHKIRVSLSSSDFPHLLPIMVPCENTIVIDEDHKATFDFTTVNDNNEGETWKWIEDEGKYDHLTNYVLGHEN